MSAPSSGSTTPRRVLRTSSTRRGRAGHAFYRDWPCNMPGVTTREPAGNVRAAGGPARGAQGAGRQHPLRHLPRAGPFARARSPRPTSPRSLGLHPNTVRPHLERMRDVGLLDVETEARGSVGRPQHRYSLAPDAPRSASSRRRSRCSPGMLPATGRRGRRSRRRRRRRGREQGRADAGDRRAHGRRRACVAPWPTPSTSWASTRRWPATARRVTIAFTHCPFAELAEAYPELVCHLHRGLVEGFVAEWDDAGVDRFSTLADRDPCQVELSLR